MATDVAGAPAGAPAEIMLGERRFEFMGSIIPGRDESGGVIELSPQELYEKRDSVPLHKHGHGAFCKFRIAVPKGLLGIYALAVDGDIRYIGECEDLGKRFNTGYGNISPKNCYKGGRTTNCKINHWVLDVSKAGGRVNLYFHPTPQRKAVEKQLLEMCLPPWNG